MSRLLARSTGNVYLHLEDAMSDPARSPRSRGRVRAALVLLLLVAACGAASSHKPDKPPSTQQRPLAALLETAAYPNSQTSVVMVTMQQLSAAHREWDGYAYFGRLAVEQPQRRALFRAMQAVMQVRVAGDVGLLRRVAWVEDAIRKLDELVAADAGFGRLLRGLVFAELPERFDK